MIRNITLNIKMYYITILLWVLLIYHNTILKYDTALQIIVSTYLLIKVTYRFVLYFNIYYMGFILYKCLKANKQILYLKMIESLCMNSCKTICA